MSEQIYLLQNGRKKVRIYAEHQGTVSRKVADYDLYRDYQGEEWLHIHEKINDKYYLLPFVRYFSDGAEYVAYINASDCLPDDAA